MLIHQNDFTATPLSADVVSLQAISRAGWSHVAQAPAFDPVGQEPLLWLTHPTVSSFPSVNQWSFLPSSFSKATPITCDGRAVGFAYEDDYASYALLTGVLPSDFTASRGEQTTSTFENIEAALGSVGMTFKHVVRTWLYMDDVLAWYDELNRARDAFFDSRDIFGHFVPASTGIGTANWSGAAIATCAIAMKPKGDQAKVFIVDSPLQCSALHYRSSFSRAAEINTPAGRTLFISGTASIEPDSHDVAFIGDIVKQVDCTMNAVEAILTSRDMTFADVSRAVVYLKEESFLKPWRDWLVAHNLPNFAQEVVSDVCRDEWLFEIELDAIKEA